MTARPHDEDHVARAILTHLAGSAYPALAVLDRTSAHGHRDFDPCFLGMMEVH
jgi:hypothetical protein